MIIQASTLAFQNNLGGTKTQHPTIPLKHCSLCITSLHHFFVACVRCQPNPATQFEIRGFLSFGVVSLKASDIVYVY